LKNLLSYEGKRVLVTGAALTGSIDSVLAGRR
jgi:hypothetical protein